MKLNLACEVMYLSPQQQLPQNLKELSGIRWRWARTVEDLKNFINHVPAVKAKDPIWIIVCTKFLTLMAIQSYSTWLQADRRLNVIFLSNAADPAVYKMNLSKQRMFLLKESEGASIEAYVSSSFQNQKTQQVKPNIARRRQERFPVSSTVILKKIMVARGANDRGVQFLREAMMTDFSKNGAQLKVTKGIVSEKDFIILIFQDKQGKWLTVESQVRWMSPTLNEEQDVGVQFVSVSA